MIGMATLPEGKNHHPRPQAAQDGGDLQPIFERVPDIAVRQVQRFAVRDLKYAGGFLRLRGTLRSGAAGATLALGQVEDAGAPAQRLLHQQRAATGLLHIVAVGRYGQHIDGGAWCVSLGSHAR